MKQYTYIAAMVMSVCGAYAAVDGEHLNYKLDDFRNYFCGSWGGSAKDILTYCNNMGIRHKRRDLRMGALLRAQRRQRKISQQSGHRLVFYSDTLLTHSRLPAAARY